MSLKSLPAFQRMMLRKRKADTLLGITGLAILLVLSLLLLLLRS